MKSTIAILFILGMAPLASAQDGWTETRFHRVHLHNGNFIDGIVISDKPNEVILLIKGGEMAIRRDQVEFVELVKMKSPTDKMIILDTPKAKTDDPAKKTNPEVNKAVVDKTPMEIRKKVDVLVYKAKNASGENRRFFEADFKDLGDEGAVYLASRLTGVEPDLAASAGAVLKALHVEKTIPVLEDLLNHPNAQIRLAALVGLSFQPATAVVQYIRPLLKDKETAVRQTALSLIGPTEDVDWFETLGDMVADPSRDVRTQAMASLQRLSSKFNLQEKLIRIYARNLKDPDDGVRADSVLAIGGINKPENWSLLTESLRDSVPAVRGAAAQSLATLGAPDSAADILQAVQGEQEKWPRIYLAGAVQRLRIMKASETIIPWLGDPDEDVRRTAEGTLVLLSGQKFGTDQAKWRAWYETVQK